MIFKILSDHIIHEIISFLGFDYEDIYNFLSISKNLSLQRNKFIFLPFNETITNCYYYDINKHSFLKNKFNLIDNINFLETNIISYFPSGICLYPHTICKKYISYYYYQKIALVLKNQIIKIEKQIELIKNNKLLFLKIKKMIEIIYILNDFNNKFILCCSEEIEDENKCKIVNLHKIIKNFFENNKTNYNNNLPADILFYVNNYDFFQLKYFSNYEIRKNTNLNEKIRKLKVNYLIISEIILAFKKLTIYCNDCIYNHYINYIVDRYKNFYFIK